MFQAATLSKRSFIGIDTDRSADYDCSIATMGPFRTVSEIIANLSHPRVSVTISSAVWIQYTNVMDGRKDGQTPGDSKDRIYA